MAFPSRSPCLGWQRAMPPASPGAVMAVEQACLPVPENVGVFNFPKSHHAMQTLDEVLCA